MSVGREFQELLQFLGTSITFIVCPFIRWFKCLSRVLKRSVSVTALASHIIIRSDLHSIQNSKILLPLYHLQRANTVNKYKLEWKVSFVLAKKNIQKLYFFPTNLPLFLVPPRASSIVILDLEPHYSDPTHQPNLVNLWTTHSADIQTSTNSEKEPVIDCLNKAVAVFLFIISILIVLYSFYIASDHFNSFSS